MTEITMDQFEQISARVEKLLAELARLRAKNKELTGQIKGLEGRVGKSKGAPDRLSAKQRKAQEEIDRRLGTLIDRLETAQAELV